MTRIIKFRGKSADGKWHYGDLLHYNDGTISIGVHGTYIDDGYSINDGYNFIIEVEEDSVGQFTGLTDKNGTEIYEGDVVRYYDDIEDELVSNPIVYNADCCAFCIDDKSKDPIGLFAHWEYEVIGNIHDKKEKE